jgi:hypothetical protein
MASSYRDSNPLSKIKDLYSLTIYTREGTAAQEQRDKEFMRPEIERGPLQGKILSSDVLQSGFIYY